MYKFLFKKNNEKKSFRLEITQKRSNKIQMQNSKSNIE